MSTGNLKMRPYQQEAVWHIYKAWESHRSTMCVLPTGTGKTVVAAEVINRWPGPGRVLFVAHLREILFQTQKTIHDHIDERPDIEMGRLRECRSGHPVLDRTKVLCSSVQTLNRRMGIYRPEDFDLVIFDEFHHGASRSWRQVWKYFSDGNPDIKFLGITATPSREDKKSLRCIAESCAYKMDIRKAVDDGWLVDVKQRFVFIDGLDFSHCETRKNKAGEADLRDEQVAEVMMGGKESSQMTSDERVELLKRQESMLHAVAYPAIQEANGRQGIVFCASAPQAVRQAEVLKRYPGVTAAALIGETKDDDRKEIVDRFKSGQIQWLCLCGIGTEGFDAPSVSVIAMARPTKSLTLYTQMLGRGTRPVPGLVGQFDTAQERKEAIANSSKKHLTVLDYVGVSGRHKLVSSADVLAGDMPPSIVGWVKNDIAVKGSVESIRERALKKMAEIEEEEEKRRQEAEAKRRAAEEAELARREKIRAKVDYRLRDVDVFDRSDTHEIRVNKVFRGGSTDNQIGLLVKLGVSQEKAMSFTKRQASVVIDKLRSQTGRDYIMTFGKHKGHTLGAIEEADPGYIEWAERECHEPFHASLQYAIKQMRNP